MIEDDYEGEFRYDRRALGALQGLDPARVAYVGTTAKTLAPALRLGWIAAPEALAPAVADEKLAADHGCPALDELALARLVETGELDRHLRRARRAYAERRDRLVAALARAVPEGRVEGAAAGVHLVLALPDRIDEGRLAAAATQHGVRATPSPRCAAHRGRRTRRRGSCSGTAASRRRASRPAVAALAAALRAARRAS